MSSWHRTTHCGIVIALFVLGIGMQHADSASPAQAAGVPIIQFNAVSFADHTDGWVAGNTPRQSYLLHTGDAGGTWARYAIDFSIVQIQFVDTTHGWAIGQILKGCRGTCR